MVSVEEHVKTKVKIIRRTLKEIDLLLTKLMGKIDLIEGEIEVLEKGELW